MSELSISPEDVTITRFTGAAHDGLSRRVFKLKGSPSNVTEITVIGTTDTANRRTIVDTIFRYGGAQSKEVHATSIVPLGFTPCDSSGRQAKEGTTMDITDKDIQPHIDFFADSVLGKLQHLSTVFPEPKEDAQSMKAQCVALMKDEMFKEELKGLFGSQKYTAGVCGTSTVTGIVRDGLLGSCFSLSYEPNRKTTKGEDEPWVMDNYKGTAGWDERTAVLPADSAALLEEVSKYEAQPTTATQFLY